VKAKWLIPLALALALIWLMRPRAGGFVRLPTGNIPMPAWTMTNLVGQAVSSTNFAGKVLVLNFWATWCPPCLAEIPYLKKFQAAHGTNDVVVIGASIDEAGAETVQRFAQRNTLNYPVLLADLDTQSRFGGVAGVPVTFIVSREGRLVARYLGPMTHEELTNIVTPLLASPVNPPQ
jgi:thiol-disulfide isomerase/thioredoxin